MTPLLYITNKEGELLMKKRVKSRWKQKSFLSPVCQIVRAVIRIQGV